MLERELRPFSTLCYSCKSIVLVFAEEKQAQISVKKWNKKWNKKRPAMN